jgi:UDP-glucose 6-dehydrogenase
MRTLFETGSKPQYGIIGYGVVGSAIGSGFIANSVNSWVYDVKKHPDLCVPWVHHTRAIFVCVNTPAKGYGYDMTNINKVLSLLCDLKYKGLVILISTMGVNEYKMLRYRFIHRAFNLIVCPEFLTEKNAASDFYNQTDIVYGPWTNKAIDDTFKKTLRNCKTQTTPIVFNRKSAEECLLIKTGKNLSLFIKLMAANLVYNEAVHHGISSKQAQSIVDYIHLDPRLNTLTNYNKIGCHENTMGVAGTCLPKDVKGKVYSVDEPKVSGALIALSRLNEFFRTKSV